MLRQRPVKICHDGVQAGMSRLYSLIARPLLRVSRKPLNPGSKLRHIGLLCWRRRAARHRVAETQII